MFWIHKKSRDMGIFWSAIQSCCTSGVKRWNPFETGVSTLVELIYIITITRDSSLSFKQVKVKVKLRQIHKIYSPITISVNSQ